MIFWAEKEVEVGLYTLFHRYLRLRSILSGDMLRYTPS